VSQASPRRERGRAERRAAGGERIPWVHVGAFVAGTVLVVLFTAHQVATERETALLHWKTRLATIANDRARLVSGWLTTRRADAEVLAAFPAVRALLAGQGREEDALGRHLTRVASAYGYVGIVVSDPQGRPVARSAVEAGSGGPLEPGRAAAAVAASRRPRFDLGEARGGEAGGGAPSTRLLVITVPVFSDGLPAGTDGDARPLLGVVTLGMKPEASLYALIADDAEPTRTGETLLVDLDANPPVYLSPPRQPAPPEAAPVQRWPRPRPRAARRWRRRSTTVTCR
jgi:hypothetical protein